MIIESELREQIALALTGKASLRELYRWLMERSWNMHRDSSESAVALAAEVEGLFFERSNGDLDDADLYRHLSLLLSEIVVSSPVGGAIPAPRSFAANASSYTPLRGNSVRNLWVSNGSASSPGVISYA